MKSWTDIGLIVAIVVGLICAASLPMVSVNATSSESLRMQATSNADDASAWALVSQGTLESWTPSPRQAVGAARSPIAALDQRPINTAAAH